jgi:hypothetical protein
MSVSIRLVLVLLVPVLISAEIRHQVSVQSLSEPTYTSPSRVERSRRASRLSLTNDITENTMQNVGAEETYPSPTAKGASWRFSISPARSGSPEATRTSPDCEGCTSMPLAMADTVDAQMRLRNAFSTVRV